MPILQIHLVASSFEEGAIGKLLEDASNFYAQTLYPDVSPVPIERVRAFVNDVAPEMWATAGKQVSMGGEPAPYFTCLSLKGRPVEQLDTLMAGLTDIICSTLECEKRLVRGQVIEIDPAHWYIAGNPASAARAAEIKAREKA